MNTLVLDGEERAIEVRQKLADSRTFILEGVITDNVAIDLCAYLLLKNGEDDQTPIKLFINSPGGPIRNVLMIYDIMQMIAAPITTICTGQAMEEACLLLVSGEFGSRFATKSSIISLSQLSNDSLYMPNNLISAEIMLNVLTQDNKKMMQIYSKHIGKIEKDKFKQTFTVKQLNTKFINKTFIDLKSGLKWGFFDKIIGQK